MKPVAKTVLWGQLCFLGGLTLCMIIKPAGLASNDDISYYGVFRETVVPYTFGLLGSAYFCWQAAKAVDDKHLRAIRLSLLAYAPLVVGIALTPYAAGTWVDYLHTGFGSALFSLQFILSGWLIGQLRYAWWGIALMLVEFFAGLLSASYLNPTSGFLLQSQIAFQLAFGVLLVLSLQLLPSKLPLPRRQAASKIANLTR